MRIGLNLLYMIPGVVGGTETYALGLLSGLKQLQSNDEFVLFLNRESADLPLDNPPKFSSAVCPVSAVSRFSRYYFEQVKLRQEVKKHDIDLMHSLGYTSPLSLQCPTVVSVPDLNFKAFGELMPFARRLTLGFFVKQAVHRSKKVIAISEFSRQQILREYRLPPEKVVVTHLAVDLDSLTEMREGGTEDTLELLGVRRPYIVAFSSTSPHKNLSGLVEAFLQLKRSGLTQSLVMIGHRHPLEGATRGLRKVNENKDIIWTGYLRRRQVFEVLKQADLMVFPSFYEGFGLPVLETMAMGVPVVCSKTASLPEVAGDAAMFFDPHSVDDIAQKIALIVSDVQLQANFRQKGFKNLERFSWKKTAAETVAVYSQCLPRTGGNLPRVSR